MYRLTDEEKAHLLVKLRKETNCGVMTAKKCLTEANYVYTKALDIYHKKGYLSDQTACITKR